MTIATAIRPQDIDETFNPQTEDEWFVALQSWRWRIFSGRLYKIMTKQDDYAEADVVPFKPNKAQRDFVNALHYRNVILKARQLGFTTLIAILWLDHALFNANQRVGIIAHSLDDAAVIFRDKVVFAYDHLPDPIRALFPLRKRTESELVFGHNNSAIRVATSMRSGTIHRLHISEMGKIAAKFPARAVEIVTGSLPAVPANGIAVIESTAEGRDGEFFEIATRAERRSLASDDLLTQGEVKFHFFPWHITPEYQAPEGDRTKITAEEHEYFDVIQTQMRTTISLRQRQWYISKRDNDMSGDAEKMWREYPSTPEECWRRTTEGAYFAPQISLARSEGRIGRVAFVSHVPVHTFWDIGSTDGTAIWLMQHVGTQARFPLFIENWGQGYSYYVKRLRETGVLFGRHYLPHDAGHTRQMADRVARPIDMLTELAPDWTFEIVPPTQNKQQSIVQAREKLREAWFDQEGCGPGLEHMELYHKKWSSRLGCFIDEPEKQDGHSEAADAFMGFSQGFDPATINAMQRPRRRNRPTGGMWV